MARIQKVNVKTMMYSKITIPKDLANYIKNAYGKGSTASIYMNPHILTLFYSEGSDAYIELTDAIAAHDAQPIKAKMDIVKDKMAIVMKWLDAYTILVEAIANADGNRTTRAEAATNIELAGLTPVKITSASKGTPAKPTFTIDDDGKGMAKVSVTNKADFNPSSVVFIFVEIPVGKDVPIPPAIVELDSGQIKISCTVAVDVFFTTLAGKARTVQVGKLKKGTSYNGYSYSKNGNTQMSLLSAAIRIDM